MGGRTEKELKKTTKNLRSNIEEYYLSLLNKEANTFPTYLPLKSCLFCHHLVKLLYLGKKRHPYRNSGVSSRRIS